VNKWLFFPTKENCASKRANFVGKPHQQPLGKSENRGFPEAHTSKQREHRSLLALEKLGAQSAIENGLPPATHPAFPSLLCSRVFLHAFNPKGHGETQRSPGHRQLGEASSVLLAGFISQTSN